MTISEAVREHYGPLAEVWIGYTPYPDEQEQLLIGEISEQPLQRIPVQPRSAEDLIGWIQSRPDKLDRALEGDLTEVLTREILERYPPVPEEVLER